MKSKNNIGLLNHIMLLYRPNIADKSEDGYAYSYDYTHGMIAVFDGCGGLGAQEYACFQNKTAAYIAARVVGKSVLDWYGGKGLSASERFDSNEQTIAESLKAAIDKALQYTLACVGRDQSPMFGSMIRSLPSTASIVMMEYATAQAIRCLFLWAGDSRGYILHPNGFAQCTTDDLRYPEDAFDNLYADSPLSNVISGDGQYSMNTLRLTCTPPVIIITCTDGVFGYLPSPMHFEWLLLTTMLRSSSFAQWQNALMDELSSVTADDCAMMLAVFGWTSYQHMKKSFSARLQYLNQLLASAQQNEALLAQAWQQYKQQYYTLQKQ